MPKPRICQSCSQPKIIEARGLCRQCYGIAQRSGDLDDFTRDQATTFGLQDEIVKLYNDGLLVLDIAKKYKVSKNTIYRTLERAGCNRKIRKYNIDETVFDTLDNEHAAYWLGFIYADGYIPIDRNYLSVGLQVKDEDHLHKLKEFLNTNAPIRYYKQNNYIQARLSVSSFRLCEELRGLGIIVGRNNFTLSAKFLTRDTQRHFIRGLVDGDGWVSKNNKSPLVGVVGQHDILDWINSIVHDELSLDIQEKEKVGKNNIVQSISFRGRLQAVKLASWLYDGASIFMPRKYENYKSWDKLRTTTGEKNGNSKLKWNQVNEMRQLWLTGKYSKASLGRMFRVTPRMVQLIINNEVWKVNG